MSGRGTLRIPRSTSEARAIDELVALARRREVEQARLRYARARVPGEYGDENPFFIEPVEDSYGDESQP